MSKGSVEEALKTEREKLYTIFNTLKDGIYIVSEDYVLEFMNKAFIDAFGHQTGEKCYRAFYGRSKPCPKCDIPEVLRGKTIEKEWTYPESGKTYSLISMPFKNSDSSISKLMISRDITGEKQIEEALRESEKKYRDLVEHSLVGVYIIQNDVFKYVNGVVADILGYSRSELIGMDYRKLLPPDSMELVVRKVTERQRGIGQPIRYEFKALRKNGEKVDVEVFSTPSIYQGKPAVQGTVIDITEHKRAEEQILKQSAVLDAINRVFRETLTCETEEEVARMSLAVAEELTGSKFGFIGEVNEAGRFDTIALSDPGWEACIVPKTKAAVMIKDMEIRGIWGRVLKNGKSLIVNDPASHPARVGTPEGHPPLTSFLGVPLKRAGRTIGMIGLANKELGYTSADKQAVEALSVAFVEALTRKRAEETLRESEEKFRSLFENAINGIYRSTLEGKFTAVNPAMVNMLGYDSAEEVLKLDMAKDVYYNPDDRRRALKQLEDAEHFRGLELTWKRKNGEPIIVRINGRVIRNPAGEVEGYEGIVEDITEQKRAEEEIKRRVKELEEFYEMAVGRELKMIELEKEIERLKEELKRERGGGK